MLEDNQSYKKMEEDEFLLSKGDPVSILDNGEDHTKTSSKRHVLYAEEKVNFYWKGSSGDGDGKMFLDQGVLPLKHSEEGVNASIITLQGFDRSKTNDAKPNIVIPCGSIQGI
ncbi:hypothetical protein ACA910_012843 [Epithemia clementina (nom. ined.)]